MSKIDKILSEVYKNEVNLESQEVHLGLVDDFKKQYNTALDLQEKAEIAIIDYNSLATKIIANLNAAGQAFLKANTRYQDIEKLSKELGVEPSSVLKNQKETISIAIKEIDTYIKKISSNKVNV